jgi:chromosome segregation protein
MRLKHLSIQGFKTFVQRTDLVFGEGLTAIVGPNGSGKSNVADAVRWVLGEQSLSQLRAKKTEDLIFAGSSNRAPLGVAEVSITIDNTDHLLPIEFGEVVLTRRAFRSGDNEYYINKSRVRLREVLDLASSLGQAYTVVGQGLVDAALSLRPEERRELFEEAAAIRGYFVQREDAFRRLARTEENIARVHDLATELEPQVRRLERQAKQAQEYARAEAELHSALAVWYRERWARSVAELLAGEQSESEAAQTARGKKAALAACNARIAEARAEVRSLAERVSSLHEQQAHDQARHATHSQAQAVLSERLVAARAQYRAIESDEAALRASSNELDEQLKALAADISARTRAAHELAESSRDLTVQLADRNEGIKEAVRLQAAAAREVEDRNRRVSELEARLEGVVRRQAESKRVALEAENAIGDSDAAVWRAQRERDVRHATLLNAQQGVSLAEKTFSESQTKLTEARAHLTSLEGARRDAQRKVESVAGQIAALSGEQQASLHAGVRSVVAAMKSGKLGGHVGTVAELFRVPNEFETAIEAALGGRLQDVVVRSWADAEAAIAHLKQTGGGRATFLPIDTLRGGRATEPPAGSGIVGVAVDLVEYTADLKVLALMLLGRIVLLEDLSAARRTLRALHEAAPWTLATLGGEVVRPGGSVTGGSDARGGDTRHRDRSLLGRERRLRELRADHERAVTAVRLAEIELEAANQELREAELAQAHSSSLVEERRRVLVAAQMAHNEQQNVVARLSQELAWRSGLLSEARSQIEGLEVETASLREALTEAASGREPLAARAAELSADVSRLSAERDDVARGMSERQTRLAVLQEALSNARARERDLKGSALQVQEQLAQLSGRLESIQDEIKATDRQLVAESSEVTLAAERLALLGQSLGPAEQAVRAAEHAISVLEVEQTALQGALLDAETAHSRASVERQRCLGVLDSLRVELIEELGQSSGDYSPSPAMVQLDDAAEKDPLAWPLPDEPTDAASVEAARSESPQERERKVYALKSKLARLGPVNPLASEEHRELADRHSYLQTQLVDLVAAAESLKRVISELDRTMRDQFAQTFVQVNEAFEHFFLTLFGGGHARLELTNPDDIATSGVEILAQAPGKRLQPLAALSGGERALTSAALLFALLRVRPVPFCVLDEVDAALDESNVARFRTALQELGANTQFVVITHNRGTIEAADTLYGVSMAGDGTSKILSLQVSAESVA